MKKGREAPQWPTLPQSCPCSTIGAAQFHFQVRDGSGWVLCALITERLSLFCKGENSCKSLVEVEKVILVVTFVCVDACYSIPSTGARSVVYRGGEPGKKEEQALDHEDQLSSPITGYTPANSQPGVLPGVLLT